MMKSLLFAIGVLPLSLLAADAVWKDGVTSGSWTNADNWVDGILPDALTPATLTRSGADYTIDVESDTTLYATNVTVGNSSGTTKLNVRAPMTFFKDVGHCKSGKMFFTQLKGGETTVWTNGAIRFEGPWSNSGGDSGETAFDIRGTKFTVDGGTVDLHTSRYLRMTGTADAPTTLVVTNGGYFAWHTETAEYTYGQFSLNKYTKIHVHDGGFLINRQGNIYGNLPYSMPGGEMLFTGTGTYTNGGNQMASDWNGGTVTFRDRSTFAAKSGNMYLSLRPITSGGRMSLSFLDESRAPVRFAQLFLCDINPDSVDDISADLTLDSSAANTLETSLFIVGLGVGTGTFTMKRGTLTPRYYGLYVGRNSDKSIPYDYQSTNLRNSWDPSVHSCTGLVSVTGGQIVIAAEANNPAYNYAEYSGLVVGDGLAVKKAGMTERPVYGRFEMSDGCITNQGGRILVGIGRATGRFIQTGGFVWKGLVSSEYGPEWGNNEPCGIGLAGGDGLYCVSNGTTCLYNTLYVGGATSNDMMYAILKDDHNPYGLYTDSKGLLTVAGTGKFYQKNYATGADEIKGLWLGRDGDGTLEIGGSQATCEIYNLVMTNGYTTTEGEVLTHGQATLRFVSDATETGLKAIKVSQKLYLAPNAKLEVDMSAYTGPRKKTIKIVDCASRVGAFAPENVKTTRCRLVTKENDPDIYVETFWRQGLAVFVR